MKKPCTTERLIPLLEDVNCINLHVHGCDDDDVMSELLENLHRYPNIELLTLRNISNHVMGAAMKGTENLVTLSIKDAILFTHIHSIRFKRLKHLEFSMIEGDLSLYNLASVLKKDPGVLVSLVIKECYISGFDQLCQVLPSTEIIILEVSTCDLTWRDARSLIGNIDKLLYLDVSKNHIGDNWLKRLVDSLKRDRLDTFKIASDYGGEHTVKALRRFVHESTAITELDIRGITDEIGPIGYHPTLSRVNGDEKLNRFAQLLRSHKVQFAMLACSTQILPTDIIRQIFGRLA